MSASRATLPLLILFTPTSHKSLTLFLPTIIIIMPPLSTEELLNSCSFFWQTKHRVMRRRIECDLGRRHATPRQTNQAFSRAAEKVEVVTKPWEMIWNITLPLAANTEYYYSDCRSLTTAAGLLYTKYVPKHCSIRPPKSPFLHIVIGLDELK